MKILNVRPKGIYVDLEFSLEELKQIQLFLSESNVEYDGKERPEMKEAVEYVADKFYPDLVLFIDNMEKEQWL
jgi:hypothetical protein